MFEQKYYRGGKGTASGVGNTPLDRTGWRENAPPPCRSTDIRVWFDSNRGVRGANLALQGTEI